MISERELRRLSRVPLPIPDLDSCPWPHQPRPGKHYAPLNKANLPGAFSSKVVGLSFVPDYPANIDSIEPELAAGTGWARLLRDPANPYDSNAVRVEWIGPEGDVRVIGHLPAACVARLAPEIDAGAEWLVVGVEVLRQPGRFWNRPGVSVRLRRADPT